MQGIVDGQWVGVVLDFGGGNQGINKATVISVGAGANGYKTYYLGVLQYRDAFGWTGDIEMRFVHGKLWMLHPDRAYNEPAHFGFRRIEVDEYGLYGSNLERQRTGLVPMPNSKGFYPSSATIAPYLH
jgi:hypothetical protein